jgi:hypothetical protein
MEQTPYSEANSRSTGEGIFRLLWNLKVPNRHWNCFLKGRKETHFQKTTENKS